MSNAGAHSFEHWKSIGSGFFNLRASFKLAMGLVDVGTHMSVCALSTGRFLVIDTVTLTPPAKVELDLLTDNGRLMDAVIATHPFHTLAFRSFQEHYPSVPFYGTPRHLRVVPEVQWAGNMSCPTVLAKWEPDVYMRIPDGTEFVDPRPESSNHFSNVFVYHRGSRTVHNDDTILYSHQPGFLLKVIGFKEGSMLFHPSISGPGLKPTPEAPFQFQAWLRQLLADWDFDNLCSAHNGCRVGGARALLAETLEKALPKLQKISEDTAKGKKKPNKGAWSDKPEDGVECG